MLFLWWVPDNCLCFVITQGNHPDVTVFQRNDTEIVDLVRCIRSCTTFTACIKACLIIFRAIFAAAVQRLHIHTHQLLVPFDDVIDAMEIVLRCGDEDTALKEMPFK